MAHKKPDWAMCGYWTDYYILGGRLPYIEGSRPPGTDTHSVDTRGG
jgi:hypothetical protein